jgi:hypothetical protein
VRPLPLTHTPINHANQTKHLLHVSGRRQSTTARRRRSGALPPARSSHAALGSLADIALARTLANDPQRARFRPAQPDRDTRIGHGASLVTYRARSSPRLRLRSARKAPPRIVRRVELRQHHQGTEKKRIFSLLCVVFFLLMLLLAFFFGICR